MSDSESSESSFDSENTFDTSESENEEFEELHETFSGLKLEAYQFEPTKQGEKQGVVDENENDSNENVVQEEATVINPTRVGCLEWCGCNNCKIETRVVSKQFPFYLAWE